MINYIRDEFKLILETNEWMDRISKTNALEKVSFSSLKVGDFLWLIFACYFKLQLIESKIGYPNFLYDKEEINKRYKDVIDFA